MKDYAMLLTVAKCNNKHRHKDTAQKAKFCIKDFLSKCDQIRKKLLIWSNLLKKSLMGIFIFCVKVKVKLRLVKVLY